VNADAQLDPLPPGQVVLALCHALLDGDGTTYGIDDTGELDQRPIAHQLDQAAVMLGDRRFQQLLAMRLEGGQGARLVSLHEAAVADHIRGQDRG